MTTRQRLAILLLASTAACSSGDDHEVTARKLTSGDPAAGRRAIRFRGCGSCHVIPGVGDAVSQVGPSLAGLAVRKYLAGKLENTPDNVMRWITEPQTVVPGNVMPQMNINQSEARDIAAYLFTLR
jgi:cytochrome c2